MSEAKFTKGPWQCGRDPSHFDAPEIVKADGAFFVGTNMADAHLIAAAPELYEALEAALVDLKDSLGEIGYGEEEMVDMPEVIRAETALAKARGEMSK